MSNVFICRRGVGSVTSRGDRWDFVRGKLRACVAGFKHGLLGKRSLYATETQIGRRGDELGECNYDVFNLPVGNNESTTPRFLI